MTVSETSEQLQKNTERTTNWGIIIIAIIFVFGLAFSRRSASVSTKIEDDALLISGLGDRAYSLPLADMRSVNYGEDLDYGTLVDGEETDTYLAGTFNNDFFGNYSLYVCKDDTSYIEIDTDIGICIFNKGSSSKTKDYYDELLEMLE